MLNERYLKSIKAIERTACLFLNQELFHLKLTPILDMWRERSDHSTKHLLTCAFKLLLNKTDRFHAYVPLSIQMKEKSIDSRRRIDLFSFFIHFHASHSELVGKSFE